MLSVLSLQLSIVHGTPSLTVGAAPDWQSLTTSQNSTPVQNSPSEQIVSSGVFRTAFCASEHVSSVQTTPSVSTGGAPAMQPLVLSQISLPLQNSPSSQSAWVVHSTRVTRRWPFVELTQPWHSKVLLSSGPVSTMSVPVFFHLYLPTTLPNADLWVVVPTEPVWAEAPPASWDTVNDGKSVSIAQTVGAPAGPG